MNKCYKECDEELYGDKDIDKNYEEWVDKDKYRGQFHLLPRTDIRLQPITARRLVNERIKCTIGAMYFETPTTKLGYVITFIKCIKEFIIREARR